MRQKKAFFDEAGTVAHAIDIAQSKKETIRVLGRQLRDLLRENAQAAATKAFQRLFGITAYIRKNSIERAEAETGLIEMLD